MSFKQELTAAYHEMLDIKVSLGYKQRTYMSHILPFIEFCADSYPDAKEITKEMLDHWLLTKNFNADSTRRIAIINIRHFARFLNAIGKKAYIPPSEYNVKAQRYLPYIFTDEELVQLFDSIDSLTNRIDRQEYHPELILPVVFRLELCCGMRPCEPFNLKTEDIDLKTGDILSERVSGAKIAILLCLMICEICVLFITVLRASVNGFFSIRMAVKSQHAGHNGIFPKHGGRALFSPEEIIPDHMTCGTTLPLER